MNRITLRVLAAALSAVCLLSLAACGKKEDDTPADAPLLELGTDMSANTSLLSDYLRQNRATLDDIVDFLAGEEGLSYYYLSPLSDDTVRAERRIYEPGTCITEEVTEASILRLAELGFVGEVTHSADSSPDIYSFLIMANRSDRMCYLIYCSDEQAVDYLSHDFLTGETTVTVTPLEDGWYYVDAK